MSAPETPEDSTEEGIPLTERGPPGGIAPDPEPEQPGPGPATHQPSYMAARPLRTCTAELATVLRGSPLANLSVGHQPQLQRASLFDIATPALKAEVIAAAGAERLDGSILLDRAVGSMVGMAVADSLGHNFEFLDARDQPSINYLEYPAADGTPGGVVHGRFNQFQLAPGQWTDDTSMGLCLADALLSRGGDYDGASVRTWFHNWWFNGLDNAFRLDHTRRNAFGGDSLSVGLGGNIAQSLREIDACAAQGLPVPPRFGAANSDAGNGSLMRLAAVPVRHHADLRTARAVAYESSLTTHPGPMAAEACALLAHAIGSAIHSPATTPDPVAFLDAVANEYLQLLGEPGAEGWDEGKDAVRRLLLSAEPEGGTERVWNWKDPTPGIEATLTARGQRYNGYPVSAGYFGAFSIDGLAIALHCVYTTTSFNAAVVKCVNFCGDADTTGAIAAQLAGALYGAAAIEPEWVAAMNSWAGGEIELRAVLLFCAGDGDGGGGGGGGGGEQQANEAAAEA